MCLINLVGITSAAIVRQGRFSVYGVEHNPQSTKWWLSGGSLAAQVCDLVCAFGPCTLFSNGGHLVDFASASVIARTHRKKKHFLKVYEFTFTFEYYIWAGPPRQARAKDYFGIFFQK